MRLETKEPVVQQLITFSILKSHIEKIRRICFVSYDRSSFIRIGVSLAVSEGNYRVITQDDTGDVYVGI